MTEAPTDHRVVDTPQPGFFKIRLVKGGPFVGARIARVCHCTINGGDTNEAHDWRPSCDRFPLLAGEIDGCNGDVYRIWAYGRRVSRNEYDYLVGKGTWARAWAPDNPAAQPNKAIDLNTAPPVF